MLIRKRVPVLLRIHFLLLTLKAYYCVKVQPQLAEVGQRVPGSLRVRIF